MNDFFAHKSPDFSALTAYGFTPSDDGYDYAVKIFDAQFELRVHIALDGAVKTQTVDLSCDEPYTLHLVEEASGAFVGAVRAAYECVLADIGEKCFIRDVFKSPVSHSVIEYIRKRYGDELEFLWPKFSQNAVWRRKDNNKWYGVLLVLSKRKLGLDSDEVVDIIDLRIDPARLPAVVDGKKYFLGYHMNKKNWFTICLDGSVSAEEIFEWVDKSYELANKKK